MNKFILALLVAFFVSNVTFAQNVKKVKEPVKRKAVAAQQSQAKKNEVMSEILNKAIESEKSLTKKKLGEAVTGFVVGPAVVIGGAFSLNAPAIYAGLSLTVGGAGALIGGELKRAMHVDNKTSDPQYAFIINALGKDMLGRFSVVLVNPSQAKKAGLITPSKDGSTNPLEEFLAHPRRVYPYEKLKNGEYRFYFIPTVKGMYATHIWIDINAEYRLIFIRSDSISSGKEYEREIGHIIRGPKYDINA